MMRSKGKEDAYFAASNSKNGFFSYYSQCFDDARVGRLYAIKGGPGTGKSRFMRDVAETGELVGWRTEYIYCSSDPDSLDGVIMTGERACIALLDATAPHVYEPSRPGVREEIVNLGAFWHSEALAEKRDEVDALNAQKSAAYRLAYRYLAGAGEMLSVREELIEPFVRREAIIEYAEKLLRDIPVGSGYSVRPSLMRSVGMQGSVGFDSLFLQASRRVLITDCRGIARYLMGAIGEIAVKRRQAIRVSHDPIDPDVIDAILFCNCGVVFAVGSEEELAPYDKVVGMRRFLETWRMRDVREELNYAERMRRAMLDGAVESLARVREAHFQLEEIYSSAMDFDAKEKFTKSFCEKLFDLQNL